MKYVHNTNYIHEAMDIRLGKSVEVFLATKRPFHIHIFRTEHVIQNEYKISHMGQLLRKLSCNWSEWVIEFNGLSGDSGERGPYSPYKTCTHSLYIGIIIFPHIDNPQSTGGHNLLQGKIYLKRNKSGATHRVDLSLEFDTLHQFTIPLMLNYFHDWNRATHCNNKPTWRKQGDRKEYYKESNQK